MNDGYMQLELAEESRKLTTFYTHREFKHFKRLRSRLNSAVEIFNEEVRKVVALELMPSVSMMTSRYLVPLRKKRYPTCTTVVESQTNPKHDKGSVQPVFGDVL